MRAFIFSLFFLNIFCLNASNCFILEREKDLSLIDFYEIVYKNKPIYLSEKSIKRLDETRNFVNTLLERNEKVYGLTTGFADLRNCVVSSDQAGQLSTNIIESHDAGIGKPLPYDIVLGAMVCRCFALSKGNSAFKTESLQTLISMINNKIIPVIPSFGSLGASGDLAFLAKLGRAMKGDDVEVFYEGNIISAKEALEKANIAVFKPAEKEGLALTNGTSFMASMLAIAFLREVHEFENAIALQGLFLNSAKVVDAAFNESIQDSRNQVGQKKIAKIFRDIFKDSPFVDHSSIQNDYCMRCIPQIFGPKIELLLNVYDNVVRELNAVTDNPLIYKNEEITGDVHKDRIFEINNDKWTVLSGGNFHGEYITAISDYIALSNSKIALTLERQLTYLLNPDRNKMLPCYLVCDKKNLGLLSGYMIVQYTANALAQKIASLATPFSMHNITSGNEAEDVVSYGASAALRLLEQIDFMHHLNTVYLTEALQAYAISRQDLIDKGINISENIATEKIFKLCLDKLSFVEYPTKEDIAFDKIYKNLSELLKTTKIREIINCPIASQLNCIIKGD